MKKVIAAAIMIAFAASTSFAADAVYKAKNGDVTAPAAKHGSVKLPAKFEGKEDAHKFCFKCHGKDAPNAKKCGDCHKKK